MDELEKFAAEVRANIKGLGEDRDVQALSRVWAREVTRHKYTYNFSWLGRPIIQTPQDMIAMQEIIWRTPRPDLIIETGVAHGGSLIYYAIVAGADKGRRRHRARHRHRHPRAQSRGNQKAPDGQTHTPVPGLVGRRAGRRGGGSQARRGRQGRVMVVLDSNHTHEHVLKELELYAPFVTKDCYLVVFDTLLDDMPDDLVQNRPWGQGNNPKTAVRGIPKARRPIRNRTRILSTSC